MHLNVFKFVGSVDGAVQWRRCGTSELQIATRADQYPIPCYRHHNLIGCRRMPAVSRMVHVVTGRTQRPGADRLSLITNRMPGGAAAIRARAAPLRHT